MVSRPHIAVVSPFLDKRHGTERCVAEQIERLADDYEIHLYSAEVQDVDLSRISWHRIPRLPGPHLASYLWFFAANHLLRSWDRQFRKLDFDLVFSPGINCLDADVIAVHIVFAEFHRQVQQELSLWRNPLLSWPILIHRRLSYRLFMALERRVYARKDVPLAIISRKMGDDLARFYNRRDRLSLVYHGVDLGRLNPELRSRVREEARRNLGLPENAFVLLLVGNDWKKKGLPCLLEAVGRLDNPNLWVLVRGRDDLAPYKNLVNQHRLAKRVLILPSRPEVEFYYAAADLYVGPSLEDSFALPPLEAMACGLPVIVSRQAGVSEIATDGVDGLILEDPGDSQQLANLIRRLYEDPALRKKLGESAVRTARQYTWERNAEQMKLIFEQVLRERQAFRRDGRKPS